MPPHGCTARTVRMQPPDLRKQRREQCRAAPMPLATMRQQPDLAIPLALLHPDAHQRQPERASHRRHRQSRDVAAPVRD
jgi:hypothetical protein